MSQVCDLPVPWETLVLYWADDLPADAQEALEEHLMGCGPCTAASAQVARITEALRALLPPLLTPERLLHLRQQGVSIVENAMLPGERRQVVFPHAADLLLHRLGGLDLAQAERVRFTLRAESSGRILVAVDDAPFDRERGELLLACQKHYAVMPPDTVAEVRVERSGAGEQEASYTILHEFPPTA